MSEPAQAAPSKAAKIWRRTVVGVCLGAGVGLLLWFAYQNGTPWPVASIGALLACACAAELHSMGRFAEQGWLFVLVPPCIATFATVSRAAAGWAQETEHGRSVYDSFANGGLGSELLVAISIGLIGHAVVRAGATSARSPWIAGAWALAASIWLISAAQTSAAALHTRWWIFAAAGLVFLAGVARVAGLGANLFWTVFLSSWLAVGLPAMAKVWFLYDLMGLVALIALSKIGDIAGYYAGSALGRHHPFPQLSPGKTVEGCAASLIAGTLAGLAAVELGWLPNTSTWAALCAGAVVNVAAQGGDLLESWVKRRAGVKDSGTMFGPSGGVLDVVDSLLCSVPAALCAWPYLF